MANTRWSYGSFRILCKQFWWWPINLCCYPCKHEMEMLARCFKCPPCLCRIPSKSKRWKSVATIFDKLCQDGVPSTRCFFFASCQQLSHAIDPPLCSKKGGGHKNARVSKTLRCVSQRKLARKQNTGISTRKLALWPRKWCLSGGVSISLRPCEMKDLFSMAQLNIKSLWGEPPFLPVGLGAALGVSLGVLLGGTGTGARCPAPSLWMLCASIPWLVQCCHLTNQGIGFDSLATGALVKTTERSFDNPHLCWSCWNVTQSFYRLKSWKIDISFSAVKQLAQQTPPSQKLTLQ